MKEPTIMQNLHDLIFNLIPHSDGTASLNVRLNGGGGEAPQTEVTATEIGDLIKWLEAMKKRIGEQNGNNA